ncbi:transposase, MuDR, Zinc finger, SWIM-type, MULE transposase domain protein [Artemisia annua]|uniref:Transposase, MuDR, Zinc finger, SWIM-type, MULE transposase domain protein n=1 Tax=Artemisia annua TaxID=35608 RepID=A0A2U1MQR5_ARTAN|nr:transposase, MuDR, Zinc finger, SWIM-type, MULE transposase domain protein [Artemisia annua]
MAEKKVIAICQLGGIFKTLSDGSLSYDGGDAHAIDIDENSKYNDFQLEIAEMFNCIHSSVSIKYFLPGNRKTLITISNDKDLQRMIKFHENSSSIDVYIMVEEAVAPDASNMPVSRSSRTTLSEAGVLADATPCVLDDDMDEISPQVFLDSTFNVPDDLVNVGEHIVNIDEHMAIASTELPQSMSLPFTGSSDEKHMKAAQQWQNNITGVGQRFNSVTDFRDALRKYSIAHQFAFKYKKNDSHRVTVKCKAEGCPWRIHASRLSTTQLICIKKMNPTHTCEGSTVTTGHQATRTWVAGIIKEKLKVSPNYKPKDIVTDIKEQYGVQLNYFQAWRGKEIAKEQLQGSYKEAYGQLPYFCTQIMETNPGSRATFTTKDDSSFQRLFVAFHASLYGFQQGCRPLLFLGSVPLKSKYEGTLLAATAPDGDDDVFPVAFAVVDTVSDDNWLWFLQELKAALTTCNGLTFVADREKGLKESISDVFQDETVYHAYCIRCLSEQLIRDLKGQFSHEVKRLIVDDLYAAAYAPRAEDFLKCIDSIKSISVEAYNWVIESEPNHWANAYFPGKRYNHMTSNFGEMFYSWASEAHELPITQMVDTVRGKIMELIHTRRTASNHWLTRLTRFREDGLEKESIKVCALQVFNTDHPAGNKFEVRGDSIDVVDISTYECSCKVWQLTDLPCCHAIAVISCLGRDPYDFCARFFTAENYRLTYSESVNPIPSEDHKPLMKEFSQAIVTVTPPPTRRPPGRPPTKKAGMHESSKRQLQCSRCKGMGHNKSTCKDFI